MSTTAKNKRSRKPNPRIALQPIAKAARLDVLQAFESLLARFTDIDEIRDGSYQGIPAGPDDLHRSYIRLRSAAEALNYWHVREAFLTKDGSPRALRRKGKTSLTSLTSLVCSTTTDSIQLVEDMINFGFVTKTGAYFSPAKRSAVVGEPSALILAHATAAIIRLIGTVTHNVAGNIPSRYERHVADVRIRASDLPVFLRFVEQQGQYLIDSVDDWLSKREIAGTPRENEATVGIGAFAWVDPPREAPAGSKVRGGAIVPRK